MASSIPSQERVVDPFASYNSNIVNRLTEILSKGRNCLLSSTDLRVTINDSTSVIVHEGYAIQDDVLIHLTAQHKVDFYDIDHYTNTDPYPEPGYNYVVLDYSYVKSRPAPQASIKILRASERSVLPASSNLQLLKVVKLSTTGPHIVESLHDFDPDNPTNKRQTAHRYGTGEAYLPTHQQSTDQSRIVYDHESDNFFFGISDRWLSLDTSNTLVKDTSGLAKGDHVYVTATGAIGKALSKFPISTADGVVEVVGSLTDNPPGRIKTSGRVEDVPVESSVAGNVNIGDLLFLSITEAGTVTNVEDYPFSQFVGRCIDVIDSTTVTTLFVRGFVSPALVSANLAAGITGDLDSSNWITYYDGTSVFYYQDLDVSGINSREAIVSVRDRADDMIVEPVEVQFLSTSTLRVWMNDNTKNLAIAIIGPAVSIGVDTLAIVRDTLAAGSWNLHGSGYYYQDVDISEINNQDVAVNYRDTSDDMKVKPTYTIVDSTSLLRVWMPDNLHTLEVTVAGAAPTTDLLAFVEADIELTDFSFSGGRYYYDVDISVIDNQDVIVGARENATYTKIEPGDVEFLNSETIRVWMPDAIRMTVVVAG